MSEDQEVNLQNHEDSTESEWTREKVIEEKIEPSTEQLVNGNITTLRWVADLLRSPDYKPSKELLIAFAVHGVNFDKHDPDEYFDEEDLEYDQSDRKFEESLLVLPDSLLAVESSNAHDQIQSQYQEAVKSLDDKIVSAKENHPNFPNGLDLDDYEPSCMANMLRKLSERVSGTEAGCGLAEFMLDNLDKVYENIEGDDFKSYMYAIISAAGRYGENSKKFYEKLSKLLVSSKPLGFLVDGQYVEDRGEASGNFYHNYTLPNGEEFVIDDYSNWDLQKVVYGFSESEKDSMAALCIVAANSDDEEFQAKLLSPIFAENYVSDVLNYYRKLIIDENYTDSDREKVKKMMQKLWKGVVAEREGQTVLQNVEEFYNLITEEYHPMTEAKEGDKRVEFLDELFQEEGITKDDLIVDLACGTGWLKARLADRGYRTIGVDMNQKLISEAKEKHGEEGYYVAKWDDLEDVPEINEAKVVVINGRSIHHAEGFPGLHGIMTELEGTDMVVFDVLDPTTGGRAQSLEIFRQSLENFGFSKEWLDEYMWTGVGSIDGVHLTDRWYPPEEWWKDVAGLYGYTYGKVVEPNYDGTGTDNMVQILKLVKDPEQKQALIDQSFKNLQKIMNNQPRNNNGFKISNWNFRPRKNKN